MCIVSIAVQKGGCGKTTTTLNLAAALHHQGKKILLLDADPQASLSEAMGLSGENLPSLSTELSKEIKGEESDLSKAIVHTGTGLDVVPASVELAWAELELVGVYGREHVFTWMLEKVKGNYDFIFIDCPPSMGMLTVNALVASDLVLMPVAAEQLPLYSLRGFMPHFRKLKKLNKTLGLLGIVPTMYDERRKINRQTCELMIAEYGDAVFQTRIRENTQLANAHKAGKDICHFDRRAHGAADYQALAVEFMDRYDKLRATTPQEIIPEETMQLV
jgi:chromosome partitioning protein